MLQNLNQNFNEIKSKEHFLQSLIDNIPDGIRVIDENYNIVIANPPNVWVRPHCVKKMLQVMKLTLLFVMLFFFSAD